MIRNVGGANRAKKNRIELLELLCPVFRHQRPFPLIPIRSPIKTGHAEFETAIPFRQSIKHPETGSDHFLTDAISRDGGNPVIFHVSTLF